MTYDESTIELRIPLGADRFATVQTPGDLTSAEAERLAAIIRTLGLEEL